MLTSHHILYAFCLSGAGHQYTVPNLVPGVKYAFRLTLCFGKIFRRSTLEIVTHTTGKRPDSRMYPYRHSHYCCRHLHLYPHPHPHPRHPHPHPHLHLSTHTISHVRPQRFKDSYILKSGQMYNSKRRRRSKKPRSNSINCKRHHHPQVPILTHAHHHFHRIRLKEKARILEEEALQERLRNGTATPEEQERYGIVVYYFTSICFTIITGASDFD